MIELARMLHRGRGRAGRLRFRLTIAAFAVAALLLCYGLSLADLDDEWSSLAGLALGLMTVPVVGLIHQANRLATATRERRLAALRLAGATPGEVRRLGAIEGGSTALLGSAAGAVPYLLTHLAGPYLPIPVVVAVLTLSGALSGAYAGRQVIASPLGVVRRARPRGPRALDLVLVLAGIGLITGGLLVKGGFPIAGKYGTAVVIAAGAVLLLFGLTLATTWLIRAIARRVGSRTGSPETLLAARAVEHDPRAWARALSLVGLAVFFAAAAGAQQAIMGRYLFAHALVDLAVLIALCTAAVALVVHQAEELIDRRGSLVSLAAAGVSRRSLARVLLRQALIASAPVCCVAAIAGVLFVAFPVLEIVQVEDLGWAVPRTVLVAGVGVLAAVLVAMAVRPFLRAVLTPSRREVR